MKNTLLVLSFFACFPWLAAQQSPKFFGVLEKYLTQKNFDTTYNQLIWNAASGFLKNTPYQSKLLINERPDIHSVNIYVLKNDPQELFAASKCNCSYYYGSNVIVCDEALLHHFFNLLDLPDGTFINPNLKYFLMQWIIGHEIGHLIHGHKSSNLLSTGAQGENDALFDHFSNNMELEADIFTVEKLLRNNQTNIFVTWIGLSNLISTTNPKETLQSWATGDTSPIILKYNPKYPHPPWLVRYLMMAMLLNKYYNLDNSGYFEFLKKRIVLNPDKKYEPETLCKGATPPVNLEENAMTHLIDSLRNESQKEPFDLLIAEIDARAVYQLFISTQYSQVIQESTPLIDSLKQYTSIRKEDAAVEYLSTTAQIRGTTYLMQQEFDKAEADFRLAFMAKAAPEPLNKIGLIMLHNGKTAAAKKFFQTAQNLDPANAEAILGLGLLAQEEGNVAEWRESLLLVKQIDSNYLVTPYLKYDAFWPASLIKRLADARTRVADTTINEFRLQSSLVHIGTQCFQEKKYDAALNLLQGVLKKMERAQKPSRADSLLQASCLEYCGRIYMAKRHPDSSAQYLRNNIAFRKALLKTPPISDTSRFLYAQALSFYGTHLNENTTKIDSAADCLRIAVEQLRLINLKKPAKWLPAMDPIVFNAAETLLAAGQEKKGLQLLQEQFSRYEACIYSYPELLGNLFEVVRTHTLLLKQLYDASGNEEYRKAFLMLNESMTNLIKNDRHNWGKKTKEGALNEVQQLIEFFNDPAAGYMVNADNLAKDLADFPDSVLLTHPRFKRMIELYEKALPLCKEEWQSSVISSLLEAYQKQLNVMPLGKEQLLLLQKVSRLLLQAGSGNEDQQWVKSAQASCDYHLVLNLLFTDQYEAAEHFMDALPASGSQSDQAFFDACRVITYFHTGKKSTIPALEKSALERSTGEPTLKDYVAEIMTTFATENKQWDKPFLDFFEEWRKKWRFERNFFLKIRLYDWGLSA